MSLEIRYSCHQFVIDGAEWEKLLWVLGPSCTMGSDGNAKTGSAKIGNKYYIFDKSGALLKGKGKRLVRVHSNLYYVNSKGQPAETGWVILKNRLYKFKKSGRALKNTKDSGITFTSKGVAKVNTASKLKIAVRKKISALTDSSWSRSRKLSRMFSWAVTRTFDNSMEPKDIGKPGWVQRCALKVFQTSRSECFGTACSFAMIAYELGYSPTIRGARYIHAYVLIDGKRWQKVSGERGLAD